MAVFLKGTWDSEEHKKTDGNMTIYLDSHGRLLISFGPEFADGKFHRESLVLERDETARLLQFCSMINRQEFCLRVPACKI